MEGTIWRFGVVANIKEYHIGKDGKEYRGTKPFIPGTKVYIGGKGMDSISDTIGVIGRNRFGRIALEWIPVNCLENIRTQRIYKPYILDMIRFQEFQEGWKWWGRTASDRKETQQFVERLRNSFNS